MQVNEGIRTFFFIVTQNQQHSPLQFAIFVSLNKFEMHNQSKYFTYII